MEGRLEDVLGGGSPEADPETGIWLQVASSGSEPGKQPQESGEEREGMDVLMSSVLPATLQGTAQNTSQGVPPEAQGTGVFLC